MSIAYIVRAMKKRRSLTPYEQDCAARLKAIWQRRKSEEGLSQAKLAEAMGMTQPGVGQYLNANIPLNTDVLIKFSQVMRFDIEDVDPENPVLSIFQDQRLKEIVFAYQAADDDGKQLISNTAVFSKTHSK